MVDKDEKREGKINKKNKEHKQAGIDCRKFLLERESDIAMEIENFDGLRTTFIMMFGREPQQDMPTQP